MPMVPHTLIPILLFFSNFHSWLEKHTKEPGLIILTAEVLSSYVTEWRRCRACDVNLSAGDDFQCSEIRLLLSTPNNEVVDFYRTVLSHWINQRNREIEETFFCSEFFFLSHPPLICSTESTCPSFILEERPAKHIWLEKHISKNVLIDRTACPERPACEESEARTNCLWLSTCCWAPTSISGPVDKVTEVKGCSGLPNLEWFPVSQRHECVKMTSYLKACWV